MSVSTQFGLLLLCLACSWFFAGIETGLISINRLRLQHLVRRKVRGAETLQKFLRSPDELFGTVLVGSNLVNTAATVLAIQLGVRALGPVVGSWLGEVLIIIVLLAFCEYFSKAWFQSFPASRCLPFAPLLQVARWLLWPISRPLMLMVRVLIPLPGTERHKPFITRDEIIHLAREGQSSGVLTPAEHRMIHEVMQLKTKTCREIMTAREQMEIIYLGATCGELFDRARARGYNHLPVYDAVRKIFVGVAHVTDVLAEDPSLDRPISEFMKPAQFVSEHTPVDHLLPRLRVTRQKLALVTDHRLDVIGLVTLDDVVDEIIGHR